MYSSTMEPRQLCYRWWELQYSKYDWIIDSGIPWNLNDSSMKPMVLSELRNSEFRATRSKWNEYT